MTALAPRTRAWLAAALLAPIVVHVALVAPAMLSDEAGAPTVIDHAVSVVVAAYTIGVLLALRSRQAAIRFVVAVVAALVALVLAEIAARVCFPHFADDRPREPMHAISQVGTAMPGVSGEVRFTVNHLGLRGPETNLTAEDFRLLVVGGSAGECLYLTDGKSWPWRLGSLLSEQTGRRIYVGNAAKSGHMAMHHAYLLAHYRRARQFDAVLVMCGINDLGACLRGMYEERAAAVSRETLAGWRDDGLYYRRSALLQTAARLFDHQHLRVVVQDAGGDWYTVERARRHAALAQHTFTQPPPDFPVALRRYRHDLEKIFAVCAARGQRLIFATQPTLYARNLSPEVAALIWESTEDGAYSVEALEAMMDEFNATLLETCAQHHVECFDLAEFSGQPDVFYDDCHFTIAGAERLAQDLARRLRSTVLPR
jgi:lysophospholipase L1-like esterase